MPHEEQEKTAYFPREDAFLGTSFAGRYQILALLGKGGMSAVYKARHQVMHKLFAVKMLHPHLVSDQQSLQRFKQEAQAASALNHPNVIAVHDFGITDAGVPYQIIDFLEGLSLAETIKRDGPLESERALKIFIQAADALGHAHTKGVIHRDLKPSNIMLVTSDGEEDVVKIVDFGIAKLMPQEGRENQQLTQTGEVFGSPLYMSPEQCMGHKLDMRSDIYSMGCLMYEALSGQPPLMGNNVYETISKQINEMPASLSTTRANLSRSAQLDAIICKAMAKDPQQRYQSMAEMKKDLLSLYQGSKVGWLDSTRKTIELVKIKSTPSMKRFPVKVFLYLGLTILLLATSSAYLVSNLYGGQTVPSFNESPWPKYPEKTKDSIDFQDKEMQAHAVIQALERCESHTVRIVQRRVTLGNFFRTYGQYQKAAEQYDSVRDDLSLLSFESRPDEAKFYTDVADAYYYLDRFKDAGEFYQKAVDVWEPMAECDQDSFFRPLSKLADTYYYQKLYGKAEKASNLALSTWDTAARSEPYALYLSKRADILRLEKKWSQAEQGYLDALKHWQDLPEKYQRNVARCLYYLGVISLEEKKYDQAADYLSKTVSTLDTATNTGDLDLAGALEKYSDVLFQQGKVFEAIAARTHARSIWQKQSKPTSEKP